MSRVLGDLMHKGIEPKIADDLYTGGNSVPELIHNWERILLRLDVKNLRLSALRHSYVQSPLTYWDGSGLQAAVEFPLIKLHPSSLLPNL